MNSSFHVRILKSDADFVSVCKERQAENQKRDGARQTPARYARSDIAGRNLFSG